MLFLLDILDIHLTTYDIVYIKIDSKLFHGQNWELCIIRNFVTLRKYFDRENLFKYILQGT